MKVTSIRNANPEDLAAALTKFNEQHKVKATQTHCQNGNWIAFIFHED